MVRYTKTEPGFQFALTAAGAEIENVRVKFNKESRLYNQYKHSVPESWLQKGWVTIIPEEVQLCM